MALSWVIPYKRVVKFQPDARRLDERGTIIPTLFVTDKVHKQTDELIEDLIDEWIAELIDGLTVE